MSTSDVQNRVIEAIKSKNPRSSNDIDRTEGNYTRSKMAQAPNLSTGNLRTMQSDGRASFEADMFPHLDALWRTALWLTMRGSLAEKLVLKTMTRAYREWEDSGNSVSSKARLFRTLTREFFGFGKHKRCSQQYTPYYSEDIKIKADTEGRNPQSRMAAIEDPQQPRLAGISQVAVKGAIARLRPLSRLMLILLYREHFSHADIAYITDLPKNAIKVVLTRLRRLIPEQILSTADRLREATQRPTAVGTNGGDTDVIRKKIFLKLPFTPFRQVPADAAAESWENEGGAVVSQRGI